jgi:hypothetical protein
VTTNGNTHVELSGELGLVRQLLPRLEVAQQDLSLDAGGGLFKESFGLEGFEHLRHGCVLPPSCVDSRDETFI